MEQPEVKKLSPLGTVIFVMSLLVGVLTACFLVESKPLQSHEDGVEPIIIASSETYEMLKL